jgi:hypothetical protein
MRSSAVGPDRAVERSSAPPPEAANLYAYHEVMCATACGPTRKQSFTNFKSVRNVKSDIRI